MVETTGHPSLHPRVARMEREIAMRMTTALTRILLAGLISVFFGVVPGSADESALERTAKQAVGSIAGQAQIVRVTHAVAAPRGSAN